MNGGNDCYFPEQRRNKRRGAIMRTLTVARSTIHPLLAGRVTAGRPRSRSHDKLVANEMPVCADFADEINVRRKSLSKRTLRRSGGKT